MCFHNQECCLHGIVCTWSALWFVCIKTSLLCVCMCGIVCMLLCGMCVCVWWCANIMTLIVYHVIQENSSWSRICGGGVAVFWSMNLPGKLSYLWSARKALFFFCFFLSIKACSIIPRLKAKIQRGCAVLFYRSDMISLHSTSPPWIYDSFASSFIFGLL